MLAVRKGDFGAPYNQFNRGLLMYKIKAGDDAVRVQGVEYSTNSLSVTAANRRKLVVKEVEHGSQ